MDKVIYIRVTETEREEIKASALRCGLSVNAWARSCMGLSEAIRDRIHRPSRLGDDDDST